MSKKDGGAEEGSKRIGKELHSYCIANILL